MDSSQVITEQELSEILLEAAHPNLYRANAFRITQLPVDASTRDIAKQLDKIQMMEKFGGSVEQMRGPMPVSPPPDADAIREAMQRLRDPERRLVDELFWFWPHRLGKSQQDEALLALARGDLKKTIEIWLRKEKDIHIANVSLHNLAVIANAAALDIEQLIESKPASTELSAKLDLYWRESYERWRRLLQSDSFWIRLSDRIRELDHPSLTTDTAGRIRATLPTALLLINAQLAVRAAEQGSAHVPRQLAIMRSSGFPEELMAEALRRAAEPIRRHIKSLCDMALKDAQQNPVHACRRTQELIKNGSRLLAILDQFLPAQSAIREGAHDQIATTILECQIKYANKTEDWENSLQLLATGKNLAISITCKNRLEENYALVQKCLAAGDDWCGRGYYDLPAAQLKKLEEIRPLAEQEKWDAAVEKLEKLLAAPPVLSGKARLLQQKPLAYCLHQRGISQANKALEAYDTEPSLWFKILEREKLSLSGFSTTLQAGRYISQGNQYTGYLECLACGRQITGTYIRWTYKDNPLIICVNCNEHMEAEFAQEKAVLVKALENIGKTLQRAAELDCTNNKITDTYQTISKIAARHGGSLAPLPDIFMQRLKSGMASLQDIITALKDLRMEIRSAGLQALREYEYDAGMALEPLLASIHKAMPTYQKEAFQTLLSIYKNWTSHGAAANLAPLLCSWIGEEDLELSREAQASLIQMGKTAVPELVRRLKSRSLPAQLAAVTALRDIGPPAAGTISALLDALNRASRVHSLFDTIGEAFMERKISVAEEEELRVKIRSAALHACYRIDPQWTGTPAARKAVPALQKLSQSVMPREKEMAAKILALIQAASQK